MNSSPLTSLGPTSAPAIPSSAPTLQANLELDTLPPSSSPTRSGPALADNDNRRQPVTGTSSVASLNPAPKPQPKPSRTYSRGGAKRVSEPLPPVFVPRERSFEEEAETKTDSDESEDEEDAPSSPAAGKGKGKAKDVSPQAAASSSSDRNELNRTAVTKSSGNLDDDDDDDLDPAAVQLMLENLRREARGLDLLPSASDSTAPAPAGPTAPSNPSPTTASATKSTLPAQESTPRPKPTFLIPSGLNPLAPCSSLTTLVPTSNDDAALAADSPNAPEDQAQDDSDEAETFPIARPSFHASKGRRRVASSSSADEDEDTPAKPSRLLQRGPTQPSPYDNEEEAEETMPTAAEAGADVVAAAARRKSIASTAFPTFPPSEQDAERLGRPSSEDIAEFESSPSLKKQFKEMIDKMGGVPAEGSGTGKKLKALSKKEQLEMNKTTAKMNREQHAALSRAVAPKRTMADLLSKVQGSRAVKEKPVSGWAHRVDLNKPRLSSSKPQSASTPAAAVSSKPPSAVAARSSPPSAVVRANVLVPSNLSDSDRDEEMPEVDTMFDEARQEAENQKRREAVARLKERALAAASASRGAAAVVHDSDDSDLEIESLPKPPPPPAKASSSRRPDPASAVAASPRQTEFQRKQLRLHGRPSAPSLVHPNHDASESQLINAGKTFGYAQKKDGPSSGKKYAAKVDQVALNNNLLANVAARARQERAEKEAKFGAGRALAAKEAFDFETHTERLRLAEEERSKRNEWGDQDMDDDDGEDDPEDGDYAAEEDRDMDADADEEATKTADGEDDEEEEPTQVDVVEGADMDEDDSSFGSDKENSRPTGMIDAQDNKENARPPLVSRVSLPLGNRDLSVPRDSDEDDEEDEGALALRRKPSRARATRRVADDDEDSGDDSRPLRPLSRSGSPSQAPRLTFGGELQQPQQPLGSTSSGLGFGLGSAFGDNEGGGFGEGGFSQLFVPTQPGTVAGSGSVAGGGGGGFDLGDGEGGGGFSQLFEATQATETSQNAFGRGGLQGLRLPEEQMFVPQASLLPSVRVSESQAQRDAEVLALNAPVEAEKTSTQAPAQYINAQGFFTQTKPANYDDSSDAPTPNPTRASRVNVRDTPRGETHTIFEEDESPAPTRGAAFPLSSPTTSKNPNRRLLTRRELVGESSMTTPSELDSPTTTTVARTSPTPSTTAASSSPTKQPTSVLPAVPGVAKVKKPRLQKMAFMDGEASESDDEEAGFGGFGRTGAKDEGEEDEEDQDKPVEGLVDDEVVADDKLRDDNEKRQQFLREQEIADEAARLKVAQDIADGEHRKKKKDGTGMDFDDSEEEEAYRKGNSEQRKEWRRKRKLDKMDPLDAVSVQFPAFYESYEAGHAQDLDRYEGLKSGDDDSGHSSQDEYRSKLGLKMARADRSSAQPKPRRQRVVASPDAMSDSESAPYPDSLPPVPRRTNTVGSTATLVDMDVDAAEPDDAGSAGDDEDEDDDLEELSESQHLVRRGAARPQPKPVQRDEYDVQPHSHGLSSSSSSSLLLTNKRARLEQYSKDESQNAIGTSRGGSGASVNSMRKTSATTSRDGRSVQLAAKSQVDLGRRKSGLVSSRSGKFE